MKYLITAQKKILTETSPYKLATLEELKLYFKEHKFIGLDTETNGFSPYNKQLILVQLGDEFNQYAIDSSINIKLLKAFFEDSTHTFVLHHATFDLRFFFHHKIVIKHVFDTFLAEKLLCLGLPPGYHDCSLQSCVYTYLGVMLNKDVRNRIALEGASDAVISYGCRDVEYSIPLMRKQLIELEKHDLLRAISLENKFVVVLAYIEYCGVKLDVKRWKDKMLRDEALYYESLEALNKWVLEYGDETYIERIIQQDLFATHSPGPQCKINWASSKQCIPLFEKLGFNLEVFDKETKALKKSMEASVIQPQSHLSPIADLYLAFKGAEKTCSTYGQNVINAINPVSGRIHSPFSQLMKTGRLSCGGGKNKDTGYSLVNLQNLPGDSETRACFIPEPGNKWISADYQGQESVLIANVANDEAMIDEFINGSGDMHSLVAAAIFPDDVGECPVAEIKSKFPHLRKKAKGPEFCFNYGGNDATLVLEYGFEKDVAKNIYTNYLTKFKGVDEYQKWCRKEVMLKGYVEHCPETGHKSWIYDFENIKRIQSLIKTPDFWKNYKQLKELNPYSKEVLEIKTFLKAKSGMEKDSINYRIQGRGAITFKRASIKFFHWLCLNNLLYTVKYVIPVHDEINLEAPEQLAEEVSQNLIRCMREAGTIFCPKVPLDVDVIIDNCWIH